MTLSRNDICGLIEDMVSQFLYYDCKDNEDREHEDIHDAIQDGTITIDEMVAVFKRELEYGTK